MLNLDSVSITLCYYRLELSQADIEPCVCEPFYYKLELKMVNQMLNLDKIIIKVFNYRLEMQMGKNDIKPRQHGH